MKINISFPGWRVVGCHKGYSGAALFTFSIDGIGERTACDVSDYADNTNQNGKLEL